MRMFPFERWKEGEEWIKDKKKKTCIHNKTFTYSIGIQNSQEMVAAINNVHNGKWINKIQYSHTPE